MPADPILKPLCGVLTFWNMNMVESMMVSVETTGTLERRMKIQIPADKIESEIDSRLAGVSKTARIKGFRPGKVPMSVVRQRYGSQVRQEVLGEIMQSSYFDAIKDENLKPAGGPRIEPEAIEQGQDLQYTATFEVYPEVKLEGHEGIAVDRLVAEIGQEDLDNMMENLRRQRSEWEEVERQAADTDRVTVDFKGTIDGESFAGGEGNEVPIVLGEGGMLPDFESGLSGISAGVEKDIKVAFPADYGVAELAGRTADFHVVASKVEKCKLPEMDDEFCRGFGVEEGGIEKLRQEVKDNMTRELGQRIRHAMKKQVLDGLLEAHSVEVPKVLVEDEIRSMQESAVRRMGGEITDNTQLPPREPLEEPARQRVRLGLLVAEVISVGEIELDRQKTRERIGELAASYPNPDEVIKLYAGNPQLVEKIEMEVMEDQVVDWLLDRARLSDQPSSFKELMA
jgi:trigger factor